MPPRGDQIPVNLFQTTAPPSRVNFREIRAPGVFAPKTEKPDKLRAADKLFFGKRKAPALAGRCLERLNKLPHYAEVILF